MDYFSIILYKNVGYYELHPNVFDQKRVFYIVDNYYLTDSELMEKVFSPDFVLELEALAMIRINFDFYKNKFDINSIVSSRSFSKGDSEYCIEVDNPDNKIYFRLYPDKIKLQFPLKVMDADDFCLDPDFRLPCIMTKNAFRNYIRNYNKYNQLKLS